MKSVVLTVSMLAMAASAGAQQAAIDHSHMHDMQAPAAQAPGAPQAPAPGQAPGAPGGGRGGPQIDVPWNDAIPPGTAEHAARALKESSRHGEWADVKMADGTRAQELGGLSGARAEGGRRAGDPRHPRHVRHGPRDGRSARAGRVHRDRARLPLGQGAERRRHRLARHRRRPGDSGTDAGRRQCALERRDGIRQEAARLERQDRRRSASAGAARAASAMPRPSPR